MFDQINDCIWSINLQIKIFKAPNTFGDSRWNYKSRYMFTVIYF